MTPMYTSKRITSLDELLSGIKDLNKTLELAWFRGQGDASFSLIPSIARKPNKPDREGLLIKRFKQNATLHVTQGPTDEWQWLFLLQHYGVPTRLLDWTESPLVGLYFAVSEKKYSKCDGALWLLFPQKLNLIANIRPESKRDILAFGDNEELDSYLPTHLKKAPPKLELPPLAAIASRNSQRMIAQLSVFTLFHKKMAPLESLGTGNHIAKFVIPFQYKPTFLRDLKYLSYNTLSLFPEIQSVAINAKEAAV